jgi:cytochrome c biogenesis protein ResB
MRFAISLLTILGIASIIGTVLKQNEPYNNYLNQFGPFWFPVFEKLGLYSVYNSFWFLTILGFLVLSTSACQTRPMLRTCAASGSMPGKPPCPACPPARFAHGLPAAQAKDAVRAYLLNNGFSTRVNVREDGILLAAKQGSWTRIGYFLAHGAIVLICLGGLLDGNLPLKIQMALGGKQVTTGNQLISGSPTQPAGPRQLELPRQRLHPRRQERQHRRAQCAGRHPAAGPALHRVPAQVPPGALRKRHAQAFRQRHPDHRQRHRQVGREDHRGEQALRVRR